MNRSRKPVALAVLTLLAVAGCGSGPADTGKDTAAGDGKSPLAQYMGEMFSGGNGGVMMRATRVGGSGQPTEQELAKQRKVSELTAACMKKEGFEYVVTQPETEQKKSKFDEAFDLPPDKFASQYGYGISTIDFAAMATGDTDDPNQKLRSKLSPTAQKAYDKALDGDMAGGQGGVVISKPGSGPTNSNAQNSGCRGKAFEETYGKPGEQGPDLNKFDSLFKDLETLRKRIESDPRVTEAAQKWSDCMADAGHSGLRKVEDGRMKINQRMDALTGGGMPPSAKPGTAIKIPTLKDVDPAKAAALRKDEIAMAIQDLKCRQAGYDDAYKKVQYELEAEFVKDNKAQLEQYKESTSNENAPDDKGGK
ncbi:hypothetical protein OG394_26420 [Kribbella sp. NBC_01245]|uniref:hypothetical protein n=1 Tax=Kribbella sp. NBC_01245 TaxID=2903578 RepID=UPI002E27B58C|nr:hypothetical protein [Kribbella sp. NBC_01245]